MQFKSKDIDLLKFIFCNFLDLPKSRKLYSKLRKNSDFFLLHKTHFSCFAPSIEVPGGKSKFRFL